MEQNPTTKPINLNNTEDDSTVIISKPLTDLGSHSHADITANSIDPTQIISGKNITESVSSGTGPDWQTASNPLFASNSATSATTIGSGSVLKNRYDLLEKIGIGGMGTVYKALDRRDVEAGNSNFIAIKVLNDEFKSDPELLKALHSEARKTQSLAHPNILTVYDFDRDEQTVFMTMEYMQGATLDKVIKGHPQGLKKGDVRVILKQICSALSFAHHRGIIHSDFKPANVFLDINNHVKVLDFGIARLQNFSRVGHFDAGVLGGVTPAYASLEMLEGAAPDPRDDIYALACVAYELFTGSHPFNRERINVCIKKNLKPKRSASLNTSEWKALINALSFDRKNRTPSVESFQQELEGKPKSAKPIYFGIAGAMLIGSALLGLKFFNPQTVPENQPASPKNEIPKQNNSVSPYPIGGASNPLSVPENEPMKKRVEAVIARQPVQETVKPALPSYAFELSLNKNRFKIGDQLTLKFTVKEALYVNIAVINSLGDVTVIYPNPYQKNNYSVPGVTYQIPPKGGQTTLDISGPKGKEHVVAIASDKELVVNETEYKNLDKLSQNSRVIAKTLTYQIY